MKRENHKLDKKTVISLAALVIIILLALMSSLTTKATLFQGVNTQEVIIPGLDGTRLRAVVYKPQGAQGKLPAVLVIHGLGGSSDTMNALSTELARNGVLVLALNYRGHDGSEGGVNYIGDPVAAPNISNDLIACLNYLLKRDDVDSNRIGVIGYSMGSRAALRLGMLVPTVNPVIMIGPYYSWEIGGVNTTTPKNLLIIVGQNDMITSPGLAQLLFNYATFNQGKPGEIFGSIEKGTGRKLVVIPGADHYSIIFTREAVKEAVSWVLSCYGVGKPSYLFDPTLLASISSSSSFLTIIGVLLVSYITTKYLRIRGAIQGEEKGERKRLVLATVIIATASLYYILVSFFIIPLVVDWGWRAYQFAMFSGAQYTIYYYGFLALALILFILIYAYLKRGFVNELRRSITINIKPGIITVLIAWLFVYLMYNLSLTGIVANYAMTPIRFALMLYLAFICLVPLVIDEVVLRRVIQESVPSKHGWARILVTIIVEYIVRVLPLAWWVSISSNPLLVDAFLKQYVSIGLISPVNLETVKAFLPMNAFGLYYAFSGVELLHAIGASYLYEEYRNVLVTGLFRSLTVAFTMAAVMALL